MMRLFAKGAALSGSLHPQQPANDGIVVPADPPRSFAANPNQARCFSLELAISAWRRTAHGGVRQSASSSRNSRFSPVSRFRYTIVHSSPTASIDPADAIAFIGLPVL